MLSIVNCGNASVFSFCIGIQLLLSLLSLAVIFIDYLQFTRYCLKLFIQIISFNHISLIHEIWGCYCCYSYFTDQEVDKKE